MFGAGKVTLFPYGQLKTDDRSLQERLTALLVYAKTDLNRWIENPVLSLEGYLIHLDRMSHAQQFFRDALVVITNASPEQAIQARQRMTQRYPDLALAFWILCHLASDARELVEYGTIEGSMNDLMLWNVRGATYVVFTPAYQPTSAGTPFRLSRLGGQISSTSQTMSSVRQEDSRTQSGRRLAVDPLSLMTSRRETGKMSAVILPPDSSRGDPNKKP